MLGRYVAAANGGAAQADLTRSQICQIVASFPLGSEEEASRGALNFRGFRLPGIDLANLRLAAILDYADLRGSSFVGADLRGSSFRFARLDGVLLDHRTRLGSGMDFSSASILSVQMPMDSNFRMSGLIFASATLDCTVFDNCVLDNCDLTFATLSGCSLKQCQIIDSCLSGAKFLTCNLKVACLQGASVSHVKGEGAQFIRAQMQECFLSSSSLRGAIFDESAMHAAAFEQVDFLEASFKATVLTRSRWKRCNCAALQLQDADMSEAELTECVFAGANLTASNLSGCNLAGCDLQGADLTGAVMKGCDLRGCQLAGACIVMPVGYGDEQRDAQEPEPLDLTGIQLQDCTGLSIPSLRRAVLTDAVLRGLDLEGCDLSYACLLRADMSGCNLTGCNLSSCNLESSIFKGARLVGTNLDGANFVNCDFSQADLSKAKFARSLCRIGAVGGPTQYSGVSFEGAQGLQESDFSRCVFVGCKFNKCDLSRAGFSSAVVDGCVWGVGGCAGVRVLCLCDWQRE